MKILFFTIALDAQPFISLIYAELRKLPKEIEWEWWCVEGVALPQHCTKWCSGTPPRLSNDGTSEYLKSIASFDRRVRYVPCEHWDGKIEMVNFPLKRARFDSVLNERHPIAVTDMEAWCMGQGDRPPTNREMREGKIQMQPKEFLLWQMDSDELWTAEQVRELHGMFTSKCYPEKNAAFFWCRYFVGPDKVITTRNCFGNNPSFEWLRVWRVKPGMLFRTHEPPVIEGLKLNPFTHAETEARGLVFDHYSFATRAQVSFKETYYAGANNPNARHYKGLTERWEKFQAEKTWPRPLREIFPWVEPFCMVKRL